MSALSTNRDSKKAAGDIISLAGASGSHIYAGSIVQTNSEGYAVAGAGVSANRFAGIAWDEMNNTSTNKKLNTVAAAALSCRTYIRGTFTLAANGTPAQTDIGKKVYVVDDQTVGLSAGAWCYAGRVTEIGTSTYRVSIDGAFGTLGQDAGVSSAIAHDRLYA